MAGRTFRWGALLAFASTLLLVACGDDDDDADGGSDALLGTISASIVGTDSGFGSARVEEEGGVVSITVTMNGLPEGLHANHVHHGSCEEQGEIHVPLTDIEGTGDTVTALKAGELAELPLDHFETGHYVAIHEDSTADGVGAVIACGDLSLVRGM